MPPAIDLHLHTRASDGQWTPAGLVARAKTAGIGTISVTDHDVTSAVKPARDHGVAAGIDVIAGVEVTVHWQGAHLHLLLYGDAALSDPVSAILVRGRASIDVWVRLRASELPDRPARARLLNTPGMRSQSELIRAARECGVAPDVRSAARFIATTPTGKSPGLSLDEVAQVARDAGAIPILAHPMRDGSLTRALDDASINALLDDVPAVLGIEVMHPGHDQAAREALASIAARRAILVTAGSDSHGPARAHPPVAWPEDLARDFLDRVRS